MGKGLSDTRVALVQVSGLNTACPVDTILDKEEFTLEELLDEDEIVQECKSLNSRLTEFLKQKENVEKLVCYLVDVADEDSDDKRQFKYPFTACEIFCCEVESIYNTLLENEDLLDKLMSLLKGERPLNTVLAGYFSRVMSSLMARRSGDLVEYMREKPEILQLLVHHLDTTSIAEVLARLAGADEPQGYSESPSVMWLAETDVLQLLVHSLGTDTPQEGQSNAAEVLAAIARSTATPLTQKMASSEFMQRLVDAALAPHSGIAATHAVNVCLALLEPIAMDPTLGAGRGSELHESLKREAVKCLASGVERLVEMLEASNELLIHELRTTYGVIRPPVGQMRLKIVDLLASLLRTADPTAEKAIMGTQAVQKSMQLFLEYPFHNALHGGVTMLLTAFEEGSLELRKFLLEQTCLVDWLIAAPEEVTPTPNPDLPKKANRKPLRAGYCGHLTQIANRLSRCSEACSYTREFLNNHNGWKQYRDERLEPRNKVESVVSWKCGRPAPHGIGIHDMYSSSIGYSGMGAYVDSTSADNDNGPSSQWQMDMKSDLGNTVKTGGTMWEVDSDSDSDDSDEELGAVKILSGAPDVSSMADMQDDEVLLGEADASEGLLELGAKLKNLGVKDSQDAGDEEGAEKEGEDAFNSNQFWPKSYDVPIND